MKHKWLYTAVLFGLILLVAAALGNGFLNRPLDYSDWIYRAFRGVCHQMPERSFSVNSIPMAVNTRCFGIFTGLLAMWILLPAMVRPLQVGKGAGVFLAVALMLQIIDYTAGLTGLWSSTNMARFILGFFLGMAVIYMLADQFKK